MCPHAACRHGLRCTQCRGPLVPAPYLFPPPSSRTSNTGSAASLSRVSAPVVPTPASLRPASPYPRLESRCHLCRELPPPPPPPPAPGLPGYPSQSGPPGSHLFPIGLPHSLQKLPRHHQCSIIGGRARSLQSRWSPTLKFLPLAVHCGSPGPRGLA